MKRFFCLITLAALMLMTFSSCGDVRKMEQFFSMDTVMKITLFGGSKSDFDSVREIIEDCDGKYGSSYPSSLVYKLNSGETVNDDGLKKMLSEAEGMKKLTDGMYDIRVAPIIKAYGFGYEHKVPSDAELSELLSKLGAGEIITENGNIRLSDGTQIDLGSCAKGYAADRAVEYLKTTDVGYGILSLGGSVHTYGKKPDGTDFNIGITDPNSPSNTFASVNVGECAVVTSGTYQRFFEQDGVRYHHIIDAKTGRPSNSGVLSVTVIVGYSDSDAGMKADFLSTAMLLLGADKCMEYCEQNGGFDVIIVEEDGSVRASKGIKDRLIIDENSGYKIK